MGPLTNQAPQNAKGFFSTDETKAAGNPFWIDEDFVLHAGIKAIQNKDCAPIAPSDFLPGETKAAGNPLWDLRGFL